MRDFWETTPVATQQRAVHQHARRRDSTQSAALHPLRSIAPIKERCTQSERVQCLLMGCTAPSATSTNAESPTKVQPDREHSPRSEGVKPYRPQPITTSSSADRRAFRRPLPGRVRGFQARTQCQNARGRGEARTTGRYLGSFTQKLHVIYLGQFSTGTTNVAIATTVFQSLKG